MMENFQPKNDRDICSSYFLTLCRYTMEILFCPVFEHASNLGGVMALAFARPLGIPAYIYDAVTSDELLPEARITGFKGVTRTSFCHVLTPGPPPTSTPRAGGWPIRT